MFNVILSSALVFPGTTVKAEEITFPTDLTGVLSYVGHPATQALVEALGAVTDESNNGRPGKYAGPAVGESYLAVPLASNARPGGYTQHAAVSDVAALRAILVTRIS